MFKKQKDRTEIFQNIAYKLDMTYSEGDEWGNMAYLEDFNLFGKGRRRRILRSLNKMDDWQESNLYVMDYEYKRGKKRKGKYKRQTVFFIKSKQLGVPEFFMQPERFVHRVAAKLGFEDIDFVEHPEFSKKYHLKGPDEERIRNTFDEKIIRFFTIEKDWYLEGVGYYLIFYKKNRLLSEKMIIDIYNKGLKVVEMLKMEKL